MDRKPCWPPGSPRGHGFAEHRHVRVVTPKRPSVKRLLNRPHSRRNRARDRRPRTTMRHQTLCDEGRQPTTESSGRTRPRKLRQSQAAQEPTASQAGLGLAPGSSRRDDLCAVSGRTCCMWTPPAYPRSLEPHRSSPGRGRGHARAQLVAPTESLWEPVADDGAPSPSVLSDRVVDRSVNAGRCLDRCRALVVEELPADCEQCSRHRDRHQRAEHTCELGADQYGDQDRKG